MNKFKMPASFSQIRYAIFTLLVIVILCAALISSAFPPAAPKTLPPINIATSTNSLATSTVSAKEKFQAQKVAVEERPLKFSDLKLIAKSAVVFDVKSGEIIYEKNPDQALPIASISKLMTAYAASVLLPLDSVVTINSAEATTVSSAGLIAGERWKLSDLIAFTLVSSSNGGAQAIADDTERVSQTDFVAQMNGMAKEIGLVNTVFRNPTGLDVLEESVSGSYSTAREVALLYSHIFNNSPEILTGTNKPFLSKYSLDNTKHSVANTNGLIAKIPSLISSKTGTTNLAGGNIAFIFSPRPNHPVAVVVLGSTPDGRYSDASKLLSATLGHFNKN